MSEDMFWGVTALTWAAMIVQWVWVRSFILETVDMFRLMGGVVKSLMLDEVTDEVKAKIKKAIKESENEQSE